LQHAVAIHQGLIFDLDHPPSDWANYLTNACGVTTPLDNCLVLHIASPQSVESDLIMDQISLIFGPKMQTWLAEAITESYLPLLEIFDGWLRDGIDARLTLSLSPCLLEMLADPLPPVGLSGLPRGEFRQPVMCSLNMIENCKSCCSLCRRYARVSRRPVGMLLGSVFLLLVGGGPFST